MIDDFLVIHEFVIESWPIAFGSFAVIAILVCYKLSRSLRMSLAGLSAFVSALLFAPGGGHNPLPFFAPWFSVAAVAAIFAEILKLLLRKSEVADPNARGAML